MSNYTYNRIVIIGNGFDLALGVRTSYQNFLLDFIKTSLKSAQKSSTFTNDLISISDVNFRETDEFWIKVDFHTDARNLLNYCKNLVQITPSELLRRILDQYEMSNWVDIETLYFTLLITKVDEIKKQGAFEKDFGSIKSIHSSFLCLSECLQQYLLRIQNTTRFDPFDSPLYGFAEDFAYPLPSNLYKFAHGKNISETNPTNVLFLNFNYTDFLSRFFRMNNPRSSRSEIRVHGDLSNPMNPIIFGYGDDTHQYYHEIEILNNDEPLRFIKSFHYPKTHNYNHLLDFISSDRFEVCIVGHSCGLSDRTLLKTIFENANCLSIRIYHRNNPNEHFLKTIAISRHFSDKQIMRKKILPFDSQAEIPQKILVQR